MMAALSSGKPLVITGLVFSLIIISACSTLSKTQEPAAPSGAGGFTFTAPPGYSTREYESFTDTGMNAEYLLFAQKKPIYFQIFRKPKPADGSLDELFEEHLAKGEPEANHYQLISKDEIRLFDRRAIEYVFAHFHGEPYERTREIWLEQGVQVYILACSQTISADKAFEAVSAECDRLLEGFQFK